MARILSRASSAESFGNIGRYSGSVLFTGARTGFGDPTGRSSSSIDRCSSEMVSEGSGTDRFGTATKKLASCGVHASSST